MYTILIFRVPAYVAFRAFKMLTISATSVNVIGTQLDWILKARNFGANNSQKSTMA